MTDAAPGGFPWPQLFGFAVAGLGLSPAEAWASTPRELVLAAAWLGGGRAARPVRAELDALMARFPDRGAAMSRSSRPERVPQCPIPTTC